MFCRGCMAKGSSGVKKTAIEEYLHEILRYLDSFDVQSAKDDQALSDILSMVKGISGKINEIEATHEKRVQLTKELEAKLAELETVSNQFLVKNKA